MERQSPVVWNCPRRGRPDNRANVIPDFRSFPGAAPDDTELYPNRRAGVIFVLDFRLGQRGGIMNAPIHRFAPAIDVTAFHEIEKRSGNGGLVVEAHGQVGVIPAAEDAQPLEVALVLFDIASSKLAAELAKLRRRHFAFADRKSVV